MGASPATYFYAGCSMENFAPELYKDYATSGTCPEVNNDGLYKWAYHDRFLHPKNNDDTIALVRLARSQPYMLCPAFRMSMVFRHAAKEVRELLQSFHGNYAETTKRLKDIQWTAEGELGAVNNQSTAEIPETFMPEMRWWEVPGLWLARLLPPVNKMFREIESQPAVFRENVETNANFFSWQLRRLTEAAQQALLEESERPAGVGMALKREGEDIVVTEVLPNNTAAIAGVVEGAKLLAVDGNAVQGQNLDTIVHMMRGAAFSTLHLTLEMEGKPVDLELERSINYLPLALTVFFSQSVVDAIAFEGAV